MRSKSFPKSILNTLFILLALLFVIQSDKAQAQATPNPHPPSPTTPGGQCDFQGYITALGIAEASGNPAAINEHGYIGLYQMGYAALVDAGFIQEGPGQGNNYENYVWTGKAKQLGINNYNDFFANKTGQAIALNEYNAANRRYIDRVVGPGKCPGAAKHGINPSCSGLIAGAHLVGHNKLKKFCDTGVMQYDGNDTPVTHHIGVGNNYSIPGCGASEEECGFQALGEAIAQICDPVQRGILRELADFKRNQENQIAKDTIQKPPSVGQLGCVDQISAKFADEIGTIFSDPISGLRSAKYPDFVEQTFIGYIADNFTNSAFSAISESITSVVNDTVSQITGSIFGGMSANSQFECQVMETLWAMFQCIELPKLPSLGDLDFGGSFLSRPDSCVGQALYDGAIDMINNSGAAKRMMDWSDGASQKMGDSIRRGITGQ